MIVVDVPDSRQSFHRFSADLASINGVDEVHFDFGKVNFTTPGWMIAVSAALRQFCEEHPEIRRKALNHKKLTYAAHAGFFRSFGLKFGNEVSAAHTSDRFIPISSLIVDEIKDAAIEQMEHHGETVQRLSEDMVELLLQSRDVPAFQTLAYAIREMIRNVVEHSASNDLTYAAQYWPRTGEAEIAITDRGIGLAKSLSSSPKIGSVDDDQALDLAVRPGVSSKTWRKPSSRSVWANSGYGLYMVKGLCVASAGSLLIASGSLARTWSKGGVATVATHLNGTTVILKLNSNNLEDINRELEKLRGEATGGKPSTASMFANPKGD
ncbi:hypothetical protein [Novosphingobium sp.]|uniref:hypothetical protein n=1 Tax=Novosphingobium sp. TaxID=1874826 RepID=UPI00260C5714|nr:hypothetical protein [Novosphingobium sp.]